MRKDNRILKKIKLYCQKASKSDVYADEYLPKKKHKQEVKESELELFWAWTVFFFFFRVALVLSISSCGTLFTVIIIFVSIGCDSTRFHLLTECVWEAHMETCCHAV